MSQPVAAGAGHRYSVVGAGAIGGMLAWHLAQGGHSVTLIDIDQRHVKRIVKHGLVIERDGQESAAVRFEAFTPDEFSGTLGAVLLAVKAQHTPTAAAWIAERLEDDGWIVSMQNGLNESVIAEAVGRARAVGAFVNLNADVIRPGVIHDGGVGALVIGELDGRISRRVRQLADDLAHWGTAVVSSNIQGFLWSKLAYGAMLTATSLGNEEMAASVKRHRTLMSALAREVCAVAVGLGIALERFDAFDARAFAPSAPESVSDAATDELARWMATLAKKHTGIWRDIVVRKRSAEVPTHYAPVLRLAREHGIPAPLVARALEMLAEAERGDRAISDSNLDELDAFARVKAPASNQP
jgi:2-dehydropantoate 2-reductase